MTKTYPWEILAKCEIRTNKCISLQFPTEMNTRGSKMASTCNRFPTQLWLQLHMFRFLDITSLVAQQIGLLGYWMESLGTNPVKNMTHDERAQRWEIENMLKGNVCECVLRHIHFCSCYRVGLGVVQMSTTQWIFQVRTAVTYKTNVT